MTLVKRQNVTKLILNEFTRIMVNFLRIIHRVMNFYSVGSLYDIQPPHRTQKYAGKASGILHEQECGEVRAMLTYWKVNLTIV